MQLAAVKVHGFKSFADTVTFKISGELTGVVGPNGCGKSNIVDAIRWVLGESRASSLRGSTLPDVLFNGSEKRPPADFCSVELRFDNEAGDSGGMWASYPEIIVKRELGRDGQQGYFINGQGVRRRDVVGLFRGTGVAPRAYGVIEQGMVSSIAESSPEELRAFMEEAAGVSHYKDQRRESERRLQASRDNLEQLALILDGLRKRVDSLKRQARKAQRYRELGDAINRLDASLILSQRRAATDDLREQQKFLDNQQAQQTQSQAQLDALKAESEDARKQRAELQAQVDAAQQVLGAAQAASAAAVRDAENASQNKESLRQGVTDGEREFAELGAQRDALTDEEKQLAQQTDALQEAVTGGEQRAQQREADVSRLQSRQEAQQGEMDAARETLTAAQQRLEAQRLRGQMLEERLGALQERLTTAEKNLAETVVEDVPGEDAGAEDEQAATAQAALQAHRQKHADLTAQAQAASDAVQNCRDETVVLSTRMDTLRTTMEEDDWRGGQATRLAHVLQVEAGDWAKAMDAALGLYAGATAVDSIARMLDESGPPPAGVAVVELRGDDADDEEDATAENTALSLPRLSSKLPMTEAARRVLGRRLRHFYAADSAAAARAAQPKLAADDYIVTRDGGVYGAHSLLVHGETRGGYDWEQRVQQLATEREAAQARLAKAQKKQERVQAQVVAMTEHITRATEAHEHAQNRLAEKRIEWNRRVERARAQQVRRDELQQGLQVMEEERRRIDREKDGLSAEMDAEQTACGRAEANFNDCREALKSASDDLQSGRTAATTASAQHREVELQLSEARQKRQHNAARRQELEQRQEAVQERLSARRQEWRNADASVLQAALASRRQEADGAEAQRNDAREQWRAMDEKALALESALEEKRRVLDEVRQRISDKRLQERELTVRIAHLNDSLEELAYSDEDLAAIERDGEERETDERRREMEAMRAKREQLGAINWTAVSELRECEETATEQQAQKEDIEAAIGQLQETIARIDGETKTRLQTIFDGVNAEFAVLFRRLFDGGEAHLAMVGETILESGFELRVRPPGKRMFSVRMLSGGEKAAATVAFVFSILRLNPPPFCVLDEVDAPLDDHRSERFVDLLKEIAGSVQCLIISHNRGTIAALPRLVGVTQEEAGVSKIVTVTVEDALQTAGMTQ